MKAERSYQDGFLELVAENRPKILKICRVYAWERSDQEDLYQEILCHVWAALPKLKEQSHANTWIYRVALNTAISFVRKHKKHRDRIAAVDDDFLRDMPAPLPSLDPQTEEQLSELFQAISKLNETEKAVITLFLEDLSYEQMASVLGVSESNIGVLLHRAKKKLSALMKEAPCKTNALKQLWNTQNVEVPAHFVNASNLPRIERQMKSFNKRIRFRDILEVGVCIVCCLIFGFALVLGVGSALTRVGYGVLVVACAFISWKLLSTKLRLPMADLDAPVLEALGLQIRKVDAQIRLLRSVWWWYLLPIFVGLTLTYLGGPESMLQKGITVGQTAVIFLGIYAINRTAVKYDLQPLKAELQSTLDGETSPVPPNAYAHAMTNLVIILAAIGLYIGIAKLGSQSTAVSPTETSAAAAKDGVSMMLEQIRVKHSLPALAGAVVVDGKVVVTNAVGFRKLGSSEVVTPDDKFHIGSVTKSMTATVAAMLVEKGKIKWSSTVGEVFAGDNVDIHADYRPVTLDQLLSHRGGAPADPPKHLWIKAWQATGTPAQQRFMFAMGILGSEPEEKPGTRHGYSNAGYAIAGVMLERATGQTWEHLLTTMLFEPLGMTSAGFGGPASSGKVDQPWGHSHKMFSGARPVAPGPRADNPLAISPAGAVHCSLGDLAKYAAFHMAGELGKSKLLSAESFKKLHTPVADDYALGWIVLDRKWGKGRVLMHNGSNTMFYVVVWLAPNLDSAAIAAANVGVDAAFTGCDEAVGNLIQGYFPKGHVN